MGNAKSRTQIRDQGIVQFSCRAGLAAATAETVRSSANARRMPWVTRCMMVYPSSRSCGSSTLRQAARAQVTASPILTVSFGRYLKSGWHGKRLLANRRTCWGVEPRLLIRGVSWHRWLHRSLSEAINISVLTRIPNSTA